MNFSNFAYRNLYYSMEEKTFWRIKILKDFKKKDKRITLIRNKANMGVTKSLNKAVAKALGW